MGQKRKLRTNCGVPKIQIETEELLKGYGFNFSMASGAIDPPGV